MITLEIINNKSDPHWGAKNRDKKAFAIYQTI